jgi:hypothetical protein
MTAAHGTEFRRLQSQPGWLEFPALYSVERDDHA